MDLYKNPCKTIWLASIFQEITFFLDSFSIDHYHSSNFRLYCRSMSIVGSQAFFSRQMTSASKSPCRDDRSPWDSDRRHNVNVVKNYPLINASGTRTPFSLISHTHTYPLPYKACVIGVITLVHARTVRCRCHSHRFRSTTMDCVRFKATFDSWITFAIRTVLANSVRHSTR